MYDLGELIKNLRKERRITQKKLGDMLEVSEGTISKYEANVVLPPFDKLRSISSIFNVSMDVLYGMQQPGTFSTYGLTESQTEAIKALADAYRLKNARADKQPTPEQFAALGRAAAELTK